MGIFNINNSQQMLFGTEMSAVMTGANIVIAVLPVPPAKLIFDNQGTSSVQIYTGGTVTTGSTPLVATGGTLWRTFTPNEVMIIDLNDVYAKGPIAVGTLIYGVGAAGTFSISYLYFKTA
jgi:hypothetical protein